MCEQKKKYFLSIIEYGVMNPKFYGHRCGRIEVYDRDADTPYAIDEGSFTIPEEFADKFRDTFDFKETDKPIRIELNMFDEKKYPDEWRKYYGSD